MPLGAVAMQQLQATIHSGPIPPARELAAYDQAYPGSVAWILNEAQANASHVRDMERTAGKIQARYSLLHQILPFCFVTIWIIATASIAIFASVWAGSVLMASGLGAVGLAYIKGSLSANRDG